MSEGNMTSRAWSKARADPDDVAYEPTFLEAVTPALPFLAKYSIKLAVNAGASDSTVGGATAAANAGATTGATPAATSCGKKKRHARDLSA